MLLYFVTADESSQLPMAHSVCLNDYNKFLLSVKKDEDSDFYLSLDIDNNEYIIEKSSQWLDAQHDSFYWRERVLLAFKRIIEHFTLIVEHAAPNDIINISKLIECEYLTF